MSKGLLFITDSQATNHVPEFFGMLSDHINIPIREFHIQYPELSQALGDRNRTGQPPLRSVTHVSILLVTNITLDNITYWKQMGTALFDTIFLDTDDPVVAWKCSDNFVRLKNQPVTERYSPYLRFRHWLKYNKKDSLFG